MAARKLLKDVHPFIAEILEGQHDEILESVAYACKCRVKNQFRKGSQVRLVGTKNPEMDGKVGTVLKMNTKTLTVRIGGDPNFRHKSEREIDAMDLDALGAYIDLERESAGVEYNVPPRMLVAA